MSQSGRELRAALARILNEREMLNLEVDQLHARVLALESSLRKLRRD
jgi:hypothetical protein